MKPVSENFRSKLKDIRELRGLIVYKSLPSKLTTQAEEPIITQDERNIEINEKGFYYNVLSTEHYHILATEASKLFGTERDKIKIRDEAINSIKIEFNGNLLKSICRYITIDSKKNIPLKTKIKAMIGLYVGEDTPYENGIEYVDEGYFYNIEPGKWQMDTNSYLIIAYDKMYSCMVKYENDLTFPTTHKGLLLQILNKFGIDERIGNYANQDYVISTDYWKNSDVTYRDIIDELCSSGGFGLMISTEDNKAEIKVYLDTNELVDAEEMQDNDVDIKGKYGPINMVSIRDTEGNSYVIGQDNSSIQENGLCDFNLGYNRILLADTNGALYQNVFNSIKGLWFYMHDILTKGLLVFEPLDMFEIQYKGRYKTILLNDTTILKNGLTETTYIEELEQETKEYTTSTPTNEKIKDAIINIDKANGQIVLKVNSDNRIAQVALNADADNGTAIEFKADQIDFDAYNMNLTAKNMTITSDNFSVDSDGKMICNDASINGGNLEINSIGDEPNILITNIGDEEASYSEMEITGGGFRVYDRNDNTNYAWLDTFGSREYEIGPHSEMILGGEFGDTIRLDGLLGEISCESLTATDIYYENLYPSSLEEKKKNFEKFDNALDIIKDVDIYKYNYKTEDDGTKKHIGLVIGKDYKYREEVTSKDNNGADIYSMVGVLWKAVQEQQKIIEELKKGGKA